MVEVKEKVCKRCRKPMSARGVASFTGWIFQESRCTCDSLTRSRALASETHPPGSVHARSQIFEESVDFGDRIEICELIGQGGMGTVYKVFDKELEQTFAIKVLRSEFIADKTILKRFEQEAKMVAVLSHRNLAAIHRLGIASNGAPYIVMDFVDGPSLADILHKEYFVDVPIALDLFCQMAGAIAYAHEKGIIHRDLKPSNILVCSQTGMIKLVDFGIAKILPGKDKGKVELTQTGEIFGSPLYMSPEQCQDDSLDTRSDIYSMGCVMYETVCGVPPFAGTSPVKVILAHLNEQPKRPTQVSPMAKISPSLEMLILTCLEKDRQKRYQSMDALLSDLNKVKDGRSIERQVQEKKRSSAPAMLIAATVCLVLIIVGFTVYSVMQSPPKERSATHVAHSESSLDESLKVDAMPSSVEADSFSVQYIRDHRSNKKMILSGGVTDKTLNEFDGCANTEEIYLDNGKLEGPGLAHLIHLPLRTLNLRESALNERCMIEIQHMTGLENLGLALTGVDDHLVGRLADLQKLKVLDLDGDPITADGIKIVGKLKKIERLSLIRNRQITDALLTELAQFPSLRVLNLYLSNITDSELGKFNQFKKLIALNLDSCKISDQGISLLVKNQSIRVLDLTATPITDKSLRLLGAQKSLKVLGCWGCKKLTDEGIKELKKERPDLVIYTQMTIPPQQFRDAK